VRSEGFYVNEKSTDTGWDGTSDLPICSTAREACNNDYIQGVARDVRLVREQSLL